RVIHANTKKLKNARSQDDLIHRMQILNSQIRGLVLYHKSTTWVNAAFRKYSDKLKYAGYKALRRFGVAWTPANMVNNLISAHAGYSSKIPAIKVDGLTIGITSLSFCKFEPQILKNQLESPFSIEGRTLYRNRTENTPLLARF